MSKENTTNNCENKESSSKNEKTTNISKIKSDIIDKAETFKDKEIIKNLNVVFENVDKLEKEIDDLNNKISEKQKEVDDLNDKYLRLLAEYDNFKKRTIREKEAIYIDSTSDVLKELLPFIDNLERALIGIEDKQSQEYKGVELVYKQVIDIFTKLGVSEIKAVGEEFNPELHNAVMHIEDEKIAENTVVEQFQKGYIYKDKILRYSMVKVAN